MKLLYILLFVFLFLMSFVPNIYSQDFPTKSDIYWMTQNIYHESRGESINGQYMVGVVTMNRLHNGRWGNTIKQVVTSPSQFSWYSDNISNVPSNINSWNRSRGVAIRVISDYNVRGRHGGRRGITHYHNNTVRPRWSRKMHRVKTIGNHTFYKE